MTTIVMDAGHGGNDLGDAYGHRYEKNDNLKLTLATGKELGSYGYKVVYIRVTDLYISQIERARIANSVNGDLLLTIHRISGEVVILEPGLLFYIDSLGGVAENIAINIAKQLQPLGFKRYNIILVTDNLLFRYADMPSLMVGIGYLNSEYDNILFDTKLNDIAAVIARGVYETMPPNDGKKRFSPA